MTAIARTDDGFQFSDFAEAEGKADITKPVNASGPLGPLAQLPGTWKGRGFNTIWRPHHGGQDRFLELNLTDETLVFSPIKGPIPNRGLLMADIDMFGVTYMQQIAEAGSGAGLHIEPGIWVHVPATSNPLQPQTVVRMGSIPHGTVILAQGTGQFLNDGAPHIPDTNIIPFAIGGSPPPNSAFGQAEQAFPELNLQQPTQFRRFTHGVTQEMVRNPNTLLKTAIEAQHILNRTFIQISTTGRPVKGGGTANTAFLADASNPPGGNAKTAEVDATFWIEAVLDGAEEKLQLQYTQLVQLDFNGLRWPHVTVATLQKQ
jgi:hypothetical protein